MYIDSASMSDIKEVSSFFVLEGITTNPTLMAREEGSRYEQLKKIFSLSPKRLFVQLVGETSEEMLVDLDSLLSEVHFLDPDHVVELGIKVGLHLEGLKAIQAIVSDYPHLPILGTAIYSSSQGIMGALAGCHYLAPYVNRMEKEDVDPYEVIDQIKSFIVNRGLDTQILAASFKDTTQVMRALDSGADSCTLSLELFKEMVNHPLAMKAMEVFNQDGLKLK